MSRAYYDDSSHRIDDFVGTDPIEKIFDNILLNGVQNGFCLAPFYAKKAAVTSAPSAEAAGCGVIPISKGAALRPSASNLLYRRSKRRVAPGGSGGSN